MKLRFSADGQKLTARGHEKIVAESKNYLVAEFEFSQEWSNMQKSAIFKSADAAYTVLIENNQCAVPYEVSSADFCVSVFGTDGEVRITSDEVVVPVEESGYCEGETPSEPAPTVYEQLLTQIADVGSVAAAASEALAEKADETELLSHTESAENPHSVTKAQLGLENVDNTSDKDKPISDAVAAALLEKANQSALEAVGTQVNANSDAISTLFQTITDTEEKITADMNKLSEQHDADIQSVREYIIEVSEGIGDKTQLQTDNKSSVVDAINELAFDIGDIEAALDSIIAIQNTLTGGESA